MRRAERHLFGYWNGGERPDDELVAAWTGLLEGKHSPGPLRFLALSEVGDQGAALHRMERAGYGVIHDPGNLPDGAKEAIVFDPELLRPRGRPELVKVGDAFEGRRAGRPGTVRMANKYLLTQEFHEPSTGWTPRVAVTHVWPSVELNEAHVRPMVREVASWARSTRGTLFLCADWNMAPAHHYMLPIRATGLTCSQTIIGRPVPTFGGRPIDHLYLRESRHYHAVEQIAVQMPGHERGGEKGHAALIVRGQMRRRLTA